MKNRILALRNELDKIQNKQRLELESYLVPGYSKYYEKGNIIIHTKNENLFEYGEHIEVDIYINREYNRTEYIQPDSEYYFEFLLDLLNGIEQSEVFEPLDHNNYWFGSVGIWEEIQEIPDNFGLFAGNPSSSYYINEDNTEIVRVSNHWGSGIKECNWYLEGYERCNSFKWSEICEGNLIRRGRIKISDLIDIRL